MANLFLDKIWGLLYCYTNFRSADESFKFISVFWSFGILLFYIPSLASVNWLVIILSYVVITLFFRIWFAVIGYTIESSSDLISLGVTILVSPVMMFSELMSFVARPLITLLRPVCNLVGGHLLTLCVVYCSWCFETTPYLLAILSFLFYETVVGVLQWYILFIIVDFSEWFKDEA